MKIVITPTELELDPANEVTSKKPFADKNSQNKFHDDGIFSDRIFGRFGKCSCGARKKPGYCEVCGGRVLKRTQIPDFYIRMGFEIPKPFIDYRVFPKDQRKLIENLMTYDGFLYDGEYVHFDVKKTKLDIFTNDEKILAGKDALLSLGLVTEEWYNDNTQSIIFIPHPMYRKITRQYGSDGELHFYFGKINDAYMDMLDCKEKFEKKEEYLKYSAKATIKLRNKVCTTMARLYDQLTNVLINNNKNVVDNELKGQPITGMIRAVLTNNSDRDADEDVLIIGKHFISTLYPKLYEKYLVDGEPDIEAINHELRKNQYLVLLNRQPTISAKSIIAMKPVFSADPAARFVIQAVPIIYDGLAADVDGDALNVIALYTRKSIDEARKLLPSVNYLEGSNSSIRNAILEEFLYVEKKMEKENG